METAPEPLLGFDFEKTNLCALKRVHRAQKHTTMGLSYLTAPKACNKTLFALSIISRPRKIYKKKNHIRKGTKPPEVVQVPHQIRQHSPTPRCISKTPKCSLHLHTRTHSKSRLERLVANTYFSIKRKTICE